jgi:hypothetical protein
MITIDHISSRDYSSGKLASILFILKGACEKPRLGLRDYTFKHRIYVARQGDEIVGMIAWRREQIQLPEEPEKDVIIIDTLCAKDDSVREALMRDIPMIQYPTGRSPAGIPAGYTTNYNYEMEGDPKGLLLPAAAPEGAMGGAGAGTGAGNANNANNSNNYSKNTLRATNFAKKSKGPSAFFSKVSVKTGGRRRKTITRKYSRHSRHSQHSQHSQHSRRH